MKKSDIIILSNFGVGLITNHNIPVEHAYKVVKFRKALTSALESIGKDEEALRKDTGIEDAKAFDDELKNLREKISRTDEEQARLDEMEAQLKRFVELRNEMLNEDVDLNIKTMPYEAWHALQKENCEREINGKKADILSGYVEDLLEGVLWEAPEE